MTQSGCARSAPLLPVEGVRIVARMDSGCRVGSALQGFGTVMPVSQWGREASEGVGVYPWAEILAGGVSDAARAADLAHFGLRLAVVPVGARAPVRTTDAWMCSALRHREKVQSMLEAEGIRVLPAVLLSEDTLPERWHGDLFTRLVDVSPKGLVVLRAGRAQPGKWVEEAVGACCRVQGRLVLEVGGADPLPVLRNVVPRLLEAGMAPERVVAGGFDWRTRRFFEGQRILGMMQVGGSGRRPADLVEFVRSLGPSMLSRVVAATGSEAGMRVLAVPRLVELLLADGVSTEVTGALAGGTLQRFLGID
ncbi:MAG: hypothetical protein EA398_12395 [Deltaproteobacteria bacterium]|nr:MAG: hypothetical protein EA398_12395 [Deltaproteobacteria bacterium]